MTTNPSATVSLQSPLDQKSLELLLSLRNNIEVQNDRSLYEMLDKAVSFMLATEPTPTFTALSLVSCMQIDTSGRDGENGFPGTAASSQGGMGMKGKDGSNGTSARDINLQLAVRDGMVDARWDYGSAAMKLDDPAASIILRSAGGKGGRGGIGGRGGNGTQGARGQNATQFSRGQDGGKGGTGGVGGRGGCGGNGGKGGAIKIDVSLEDADLLMLLKPPIVTGGLQGNGDNSGKGGNGGSGGAGGSSLAWTQTTYEYKQEWNQLQKRFESKSVQKQTPRFQPGGMQGPYGEQGIDGSHGENGTDGLDGSFQMVVEGTVYHRLYDLAIMINRVVDPQRGNCDFVEPGELAALIVTAVNRGGMPTPHKNIEISLQPATWIEIGNPAVLADSLPIEGIQTLADPLVFRVSDQVPISEEPYHKQETLMYQALLCRVNRCLPSVSQQKDLYTVRYPVQISPLKGKEADGKTVLSLFIQNVSSIEMGGTGPQKRRVFVVFELEQFQYLTSADVELSKVAEGDVQEGNKITAEVNNLPAKNEAVCEVAFRFINHKLTNQARVVVTASLHLDYINAERSRCIQKRILEMRFS